MNKFQRWILKKICKKLVVQGHNHEENIIQYFVIMNSAAADEFTEDSKSALCDYMKKCYEKSLERFLATRFESLMKIIEE